MAARTRSRSPVLPLCTVEDQKLAFADAIDFWRCLRDIANQDFKSWQRVQHHKWAEEDEKALEGVPEEHRSWLTRDGESERAKSRQLQIQKKQAQIAKAVFEAYNWWWGEEQSKIRRGDRVRRRGEGGSHGHEASVGQASTHLSFVVVVVVVGTVAVVA